MTDFRTWQPLSREMADELDRGDVVEYTYRSEGNEVQAGQGIVCKSNYGGVRVLTGEGYNRTLYTFQCTGNVKVGNARGSTRPRRTGNRARIRKTGEHEAVEYSQRVGWQPVD